MAWLNATPKPAAGSRRAEILAKANLPAISRREDLKRRNIKPQMPPNPLPHIIERLVEVGLTEPAGMGVGPVSWQAIDAWCTRTHLALPPWEARLIRLLSVEYVAEGSRAESETCPAPWRAEITQADRDAEFKLLTGILG